ncbi:hypothetical protein [Serratia marcescens]|uniref:hypothetical protein n=1 Tax=Serratia marcescens TaxID=615 RepID=UPI0034D698B7
MTNTPVAPSPGRTAAPTRVPEESARRHPQIRHSALPLTDEWATRRLSIVVREQAQLVAFLRQGEGGITGDR